MQPLELPNPSPEELIQSQQLSELIVQNINEAGGWIDFEHYMQLALYAPSLGYYSGGKIKFGEQGDFITSPEISPLFAQTLAVPVAKVLKILSNNHADVIEFGAGSGKLAADLLLALDAQQQLPAHYFIIELSAELQARQQQTIERNAPHLFSRVRWLSSLPDEPLKAVVIANEVLDAMPVKRFAILHKKISLLGVEVVNGRLSLSYNHANKKIIEKVSQLNINFDYVNDAYTSEINCQINPWIKSLSQCIEKGAVYIVDYGYPRSEYYSSDRHMGTFMGYYRHRSFDEPLWCPGLQDLTAFVDFTEVAEASIEHGFDVDGFTSQGNFLINAGLSLVVENNQPSSEIERLKIIQQIKTLSLPGEMGERFKVLGLSKGLKNNIPGFETRDFRYRL